MVVEAIRRIKAIEKSEKERGLMEREREETELARQRKVHEREQARILAGRKEKNLRVAVSFGVLKHLRVLEENSSGRLTQHESGIGLEFGHKYYRTSRTYPTGAIVSGRYPTEGVKFDRVGIIVDHSDGSIEIRGDKSTGRFSAGDDPQEIVEALADAFLKPSHERRKHREAWDTKGLLGPEVVLQTDEGLTDNL